MMNMKEIEEDILKDMDDLADPDSQYAYLIGCAGEMKSYPERLRDEKHLVKACQVKTWIALDWQNGSLSFHGDSQSLLVKGILALLAEIYDGRCSEELGGYQCQLIDHPSFQIHLSQDQTAGLKEGLFRYLPEKRWTPAHPAYDTII